MRTKIEEYCLVEELMRLRKEGLTFEAIQDKWRRERPDLPSIPTVATLWRFEENYQEPLGGENRYEHLHYSIGNSEFLRKTNEFLLNITTAKDKQEMNQLIRAWKVELRKFLEAYETKQKVTEQAIFDWTNVVMDSLCQECRNLGMEKASQVLDNLKEVDE